VPARPIDDPLCPCLAQDTAFGHCATCGLDSAQPHMRRDHVGMHWVVDPDGAHWTCIVCSIGVLVHTTSPESGDPPATLMIDVPVRKAAHP
jgi:hypothetical protein